MKKSETGFIYAADTIEMKTDMTFDEYRYCKYADAGNTAESGNFWNRELLTVLLLLYKRHNAVWEKEPFCFDPKIFEKRLREEKIIDEKNILDLAGIEKICPVRFRRKVAFEQRYISQLVKASGLCVLEVREASDGFVHFFVGQAVDKEDVLITDPAGNVSELSKKGKPISILWFDYLEWTDKNALRDAVALVNKAVSFLGTVDTPLYSNHVIFNYDFREGEPIREDDFWCTSFVWDVFRMCGLSHLLCDGKKTQNAIDILEWGKKNSLLVGLKDIRYGDLMIYNWDGKGTADHTAICITTTPDNCILTLDACTGELDDTNGGHVNFRFRRLEAEEILGVVRPKYK